MGIQRFIGKASTCPRTQSSSHRRLDQNIIAKASGMKISFNGLKRHVIFTLTSPDLTQENTAARAIYL